MICCFSHKSIRSNWVCALVKPNLFVKQTTENFIVCPTSCLDRNTWNNLNPNLVVLVRSWFDYITHWYLALVKHWTINCLTLSLWYFYHLIIQTMHDGDLFCLRHYFNHSDFSDFACCFSQTIYHISNYLPN